VKPEAPWTELVALTEHERDLVRDGRWEEVPAASAQRLSAAQALGDPPASARPQLDSHKPTFDYFKMRFLSVSLVVE